MPGITGFGGAFLRARNPKALYAWYEQHFGLSAAMGCLLFPPEGQRGKMVVNFFAEDSDYFPRSQPAMLNFQVDDLEALLARLEAAGVAVDARREAHDFGRFGWVTDPEGNRVELWQPAQPA